MTFYTMSGMEINLVEPSSIDTLAEQREQRDERTRGRMDKKVYRNNILSRLADMLDDADNPLGELADTLFSAPIRDTFDRNAFLAMRDGQRLGASVMAAVCAASLDAYTEADSEEGF